MLLFYCLLNAYSNHGNQTFMISTYTKQKIVTRQTLCSPSRSIPMKIKIKKKNTIKPFVAIMLVVCLPKNVTCAYRMAA